MKKLIAFSVIVLMFLSCSSDGEIDLFPETDPTNIRLKYLTTTAQVIEAAGPYTVGWDVSDLDVRRDEGTHADLFWWFQADLAMRKDAVHTGTHDYRNLRLNTDGPMEQEDLEQMEDYVPIHDGRLDQYPSLYVVKHRDNDNNNWYFRLYAHQVHQDGNRNTHIIWMSGGHSSHLEGTTPPPADGDVITAMLGLLEEHD